MQWKLENIRFLYPPDDFTGTFTNEKMQTRHKALQEQKIKEILRQLEIETDPIGAMRVLNPLEHIQFLKNNIEYFKEKKCLEKAILLLYYHKNTPFAPSGDYETWKFLLNICDRDRLYELGSPFPFERVTVYRGSVTGLPRGLSWTVSREKTAWILDRWENKELGGGIVFSLEVTREDILVYIEDKVRQEVLLLPERAERAQVCEISSL